MIPTFSKWCFASLAPQKLLSKHKMKFIFKIFHWQKKDTKLSILKVANDPDLSWLQFIDRNPLFMSNMWPSLVSIYLNCPNGKWFYRIYKMCDAQTEPQQCYNMNNPSKTMEKISKMLTWKYEKSKAHYKTPILVSSWHNELKVFKLQYIFSACCKCW